MVYDFWYFSPFRWGLGWERKRAGVFRHGKVWDALVVQIGPLCLVFGV